MIGIIEANFDIPLDRFPGHCNAIGCAYQTNGTIWGGDKAIFKTKDIIKGKKGYIVKCIVDFNDNSIEFYVNNILQRKQAIKLYDKQFQPVITMFLFNDSAKLINVK